MIIDGLDGQAVFVELGVAGEVHDVKCGAIVTVAPPNLKPKPSDITIDRIARSWRTAALIVTADSFASLGNVYRIKPHKPYVT